MHLNHSSVLLVFKHYGWNKLKNMIFHWSLQNTRFNFHVFGYFHRTVHIFLKLMYRVINQQEFKHKLLRFSLNCHLKKELKLILNELYQKNMDLEVSDHKTHMTRIFKSQVFINWQTCYLWSTTYQRRRTMAILMSLHWQDIYILSYI